MDRNDPRIIEAMMSNVINAAHSLAEHTEWTPAGYMLRVSSLIRSENGASSAALSFAMHASAECLNPEGRRICAEVIGMLRNALPEPA